MVLDRNQDGVISRATELFGDRTIPGAANGFEALATLDVNHDGAVDANDPAFAQLRLWQDQNRDGQSTSDELVSLPAAGVQKLLIAYTDRGYVSTAFDEFGNHLRWTGSFVRDNGQTAEMTDVLFRVSSSEPSGNICR